MNNEPVAWMCPTGLEYKQRATDFMYNDALYDTKLNWIPLYTHPVKELTDEEITEIFDTTFEVRDFEDSFIKFARAIKKGTREMNQEIWTVCNSCNQRVTGDSIHTCSPQLKELTDEEIRAERYNNCGKDDWFMDFARAILRKAQEK